jgi:hypothetical protein
MNAAPQQKTHTPSLFQFIFNLLFILGSWGMSVVLIIYAGIEIAARYNPGSSQTSIMGYAAVMFAVSLAFIPSLIYSWKRMRGEAVHDRVINFHPALILCIAIWPVLIYAGISFKVDSLAQVIFFPVIHVLSVLIPIGGLVWLGTHRLITSSHQRNAGLLSSGIILGTSLSFFLEFAVIAVIMVILIVVLLLDPKLMLQFSQFAERMNSTNSDVESLQRMIGPLVNSPSFILVFLAFISVATPLIEEACKPLALWFFAKRGLSPRDGFIGGMLCGAGFTIVETLINGFQTQPDTWWVIITLRVGADALHIFCSGLMGYSLAKAWSSRNYWNLFAGYLIAVSLHGLWNAMAILFSFSQMAPAGSTGLVQSFGRIGPYALAVLTFLFLTGLLVFNQKLYREQNPTPVPPVVAQSEA